MSALLPPYATPEQLGAWLDPSKTTDPDRAAVATAYAARFGDTTAVRVIQRATELVEGYVLAGYSTNADGSPRDDDLAAWLADAACAQVEYWGLVSEQHGVAGVTTGTMSAGGITHNMPAELGPRARAVLERAGLRCPIGNSWGAYRRPLDLIGRSYA